MFLKNYCNHVHVYACDPGIEAMPLAYNNSSTAPVSLLLHAHTAIQYIR